MKTTNDLIESYLLSLKLGYKNLRLYTYNINGSIIKIQYAYDYDDDDFDSTYDNYLEVDLLDYITFVFNGK